MKKSILYGSLLSILSTTAFADLNHQSVQKNTSNARIQLAANFSHQQLAEASGTQPITPPATATKRLPPPTPTIQPLQQAINCNYHIPAETSKIDEATVLTWAEKATQQSFQLDYKNFAQQLALLKACYTEQGWQGFNDALQKSGNDKAIQTQLLTVNSSIDGKPTISSAQENQWKVSIPLQVVYQNNKEKLTQTLIVDLVVGRKISGDLGIMQMIARPRQTTTTH